eukprot:scaffold178873_cov33-Prasinocladus_malaysianus.AAC.1
MKDATKLRELQAIGIWTPAAMAVNLQLQMPHLCNMLWLSYSPLVTICVIRGQQGRVKCSVYPIISFSASSAKYTQCAMHLGLACTLSDDGLAEEVARLQRKADLTLRIYNDTIPAPRDRRRHLGAKAYSLFPWMHMAMFQMHIKSLKP